jgi:hypothetical protein
MRLTRVSEHGVLHWNQPSALTSRHGHDLFQLYHNGRIGWPVPFRTHRCIDEGCSILFPHAVGFVDMPKDMYFGLDALHCNKKFFTTDMFATNDLIQDTERRAMGNQDIGIIWDQRPLIRQCRAIALKSSR